MDPFDRLRLTLCLARAVPGAPTGPGPGAGAGALHPACGELVPAALVDLGGGLYERGAGPGLLECWFASLRPAPALSALASQVQLGGCSVSTTADAQLGTTAVCIRGPRSCATVAAAFRLLSAALVEELLAVAG